MVVKLLRETMVEYCGIILDVYTMSLKQTEGLTGAETRYCEEYCALELYLSESFIIVVIGNSLLRYRC